MIYLISGRPRSGKSYEAVKYHLLPAIESGRKVITNLPVNLEHVKKVYGEQAVGLIEIVKFDYADFESNAGKFPFSKPEHYMDEWRNEKGQGALYIIDEAHFSLPKGGTLPEVKKYYTMHGHYGVDILLMTQHIRQIDADILNLVEVVYKCVKNVSLGSSSTYTKKVQMGYRGSIVNTTQRKYDKNVFPFYKSHTQSAKDVIEAEANDIKPIWKQPIFYMLGVVFVLMIYMWSQFENPLDTKPKESSTVELKKDNPEDARLTNSPGQSAASSPPAPPQKTAKPPKPKDEDIWHPFQDVKLHVLSEYTAGIRGQDYNMIFAASRQGIFLFTFDLKDLVFAGYSYRRLSSCAVSIRYQDYNKMLFCDAPRIEYQLPTQSEIDYEQPEPSA